MLLRRIGKILRGKATPEQLVLACVLGSMVGFVPGFERGPGLTVALILALLVTNANIGLALLSFVVAKPVGLLALPVSFEVGRFLLDGPTSRLFAWAINAPVLALFGLEHYATTGGLLTGLAFGLVVGVGVALALNGFRRRMARLDEGSERYRAFTSRRSVRVLTFVLLGGGRGKKSWDELASQHSRVPLRWSGVALAGLAVLGLWLAQDRLAGGALRDGLIAGLSQANGATVDLGAAELDLAGGRVTLRDLAMADPDALERDLLRAARLEGSLSTKDLLRKRLRIDRLVVDSAQHGAPRATPGVAVRRETPPAEPVPPREGETSLEDWIAEAEVWKERLGKAREWLERMQKDGEPGTDEAAETLEERLEREARERGIAGVRATHLVERTPTISIGELLAAGLTSRDLPGEVLSVRMLNLSSEPWLLEDAPRLEVSSASGRIELVLGLDSTSADPADNRVHLKLLDLDGEGIARRLAVKGGKSFSGGALDLELDGAWSAGGVGRIDLPLLVTLRGATLAFPGSPPTQVESLALPIGLRGPLDRPRVLFDERALADALLAAGKAELASRVRQEADALLERGRRDVEARLGQELEQLAPDLQVPVNYPDATAAAREAAEKAAEDAKQKAAEEAKQKAKGALGGFLGGKKTDG